MSKYYKQSIKQVEKLKYTNEEKIDYLNTSLSYTRSAIELSKIILTSKNQTKFLIFPLIYNLRHGLELAIKFLSLTFELGHKKTHDLFKINPIILKELRKIEKKQIEIATERWKTMDIDLMLEIYEDKFNKLLDKYQNHKYKDDFNGICDKENTLLRYPLNKSLIEMNNNLKTEEIKQLQEDANFIFMSLIWMVFSFSKDRGKIFGDKK